MKKTTLALALMSSLLAGTSWAAQDASAPVNDQAQRATAAKGDASAPADDQAQRATAAKGDASAPADDQAQRATAAKGDASAAEAMVAEAAPSAPAANLNQAVQETVSKAAAQVGANIQSSVKAGEVILTGTAPSEEALRRVAEEASRVPGVTAVRTNVTLKAAG